MHAKDKTMAEAELDSLELERPRRLHFEWVLPIFLKPRATFQKIAQQNNGVWLVPLLILTALLIVQALAAGPLRAQAAQMGVTLPEDFQYYPPEQQEKILAGQQSAAGPIFTHVFPMVGSIVGLWVTWLLLGSILHLSLTLAGSRGRASAALNVVGWASMPFALRAVVQIGALLITQQLISQPGLSGFMPTDMGRLRLFLSLALGFVDLYFLWQIALMIVGVLAISGLSRGKAWFATLAAVLIMLALQTLPGFIAAQIGGGGSSTPFFFF